MSKLNRRDDTIRQVLTDHPEYESFEEVQSECAKRNTSVGMWSIYFVAKAAGRKLERRPPEPDPDAVIREVSLTLLGLHKSANDAISTLEQVSQLNSDGDRIPWEIETLQPTTTWEKSVAQELLDLCGGSLEKAIDSVWQL